MQSQPGVHRYEHHGLLGTVIDVQVAAPSSNIAERVDAAIVAEIDRREQIFSAYDQSSELRWRRGEVFDQSVEFVEVVRSALDWQLQSLGAFNPMAGELAFHWDAAAKQGEPPDRQSLAAAAAAIEAVSYLEQYGAEGLPVIPKNSTISKAIIDV